MHLGLLFNNIYGSASDKILPPPPPPPASTGASFLAKAGIGGTVALVTAHIALWGGRKVLDMSYLKENESNKQLLRIAGLALVGIGAVAGYVGSLAAGAATTVGIMGVTGFLGLPLAVVAGIAVTGLSLYSIFSQIHNIGEKEREMNPKQPKITP